MPKTRFHLLLEERVKEAVEANCIALVGGQPKDFPTYREQVGYIRGLSDALTLCEQVEEDLNK
jgi:hypothetical protein